MTVSEQPQQPLGVGIIGCGNISAAYMTHAPLFRGFELRACADIDVESAKIRADEYGLRALSVEALLTAEDIDLIVNLTVPTAHFEVSAQILEAGKHLYSEKPLVLTLDEGRRLAEIATRKGLHVGCAPDTFLGGAHQLARYLVDSGVLGTIHSGTCHVMSHGMEHWHPNPEFFFKPGGGPVFDLGPYYISNLVQLLGPVRRVAAMAAIPTPVRTVTSEPRFGDQITVETPTTVHALLEFEAGAQITLGSSWDVWHHDHANIELYGDGGSLFVPDPNFFGGDINATTRADALTDKPAWPHPLGVPNQEHASGMKANYRAAGLADMALAIAEGRPHRCSLELALHGVDVMNAILDSAQSGEFVTLSTTCERPAALEPDDARALLAQPEEPAWQAWAPAVDRYQQIEYRRCGNSGLRLPPVSLGLWHNFGTDMPQDIKRAICRKAFDLGITHFDLANNYGPPPGAAEEAFGDVLRRDFAGHRDELIIASKAGYDMWPGPYGEWGSRKYLITSCDQSLHRLGLDYLDIFYSHRFDPDTPLEETMQALDYIVRSGRALYVGISSYDSAQTRAAEAILRELGTPCLIHQPRYSLLDRCIERGSLLDTTAELGIGVIACSPLAQGLLTDKYFDGIPPDSRAARSEPLASALLDERCLRGIRGLAEIAAKRGQTLAQMAIAWVLRDQRITSALIGASRPEQVEECVRALVCAHFTVEELAAIDISAGDAALDRGGVG